MLSLLSLEDELDDVGSGYRAEGDEKGEEKVDQQLCSKNCEENIGELVLGGSGLVEEELRDLSGVLSDGAVVGDKTELLKLNGMLES